QVLVAREVGVVLFGGAGTGDDARTEVNQFEQAGVFLGGERDLHRIRSTPSESSPRARLDPESSDTTCHRRRNAPAYENIWRQHPAKGSHRHFIEGFWEKLTYSGSLLSLITKRVSISSPRS